MAFLKSKSIFLPACLLLGFLLLPTALFINNEPIWDDQYIYAAHAHWSSNALLGPYAINSGSYWRPLTVLTIAVPYLMGFPVWFGKLTNILLFMLQCCLVVAILGTSEGPDRRILDRRCLFALVALLVLHPIFVETSLWISARADLLLGLFVALCVYWLLQSYRRQTSARSPEAPIMGFVKGFVVSLAACSAKDTGIIWVAMELFVVIGLSIHSKRPWMRYWRYWTAGVFLSTCAYVAARALVLGHATGYENLEARSAGMWIDRIAVVNEFLVRSILAMLLPIYDQAPFKAPGWFFGESQLFVWGTSALAVALTCLALRWLFMRSPVSGWIALISLIPILAHALLASMVEQAYGSLLANRYLAPSAAMLFASVALAIPKSDAPQNTPDHSARRRQLLVLWGLYICIFGQSIVLWAAARSSWSTNLQLWESSWLHGSRSQTVARNYSSALTYVGAWDKARAVAVEWIDSHQHAGRKLQLCDFYDNAIKSDIALQRLAEATQLASNAVDIGWCVPSLTQNISFLLLKQRCPSVLPMLDKAVAEESKPEGTSLVHFTSAEQREVILSTAVYAQARCGSLVEATDLLGKLASRNRKWEIDGDSAKRLLRAARTDR